MPEDVSNDSEPTTRTPTSSHSRSDSSEQRLAEIVDVVAGRIQAGEIVNLDDYSEFSDELRELLPAVQALADLPDRVAQSQGDLRDNQARPRLGDFELIREIGRGGMGIVFEARQLSLDRLVAVKILPITALLDKRRLARFEHEARTTSLLEHPNIVPIYNVGCEQGIHYLSMRLIQGQSLSEVINDVRHGKRPLSLSSLLAKEPASAQPNSVPAESSSDWHQCESFVRVVVSIIHQAANGLEFAHQQGVVHRDIKPSNLIVDHQGCLSITDFGLALTRAGADLSLSGEMIGTLRYMSPEQAFAVRELVDHRTDIYALGATLYEVLSLEPAYPDSDRHKLLTKIRDSEPPPLRSLNRAVDHDLTNIVGKAMEKDVSLRYQTAQEFADDLKSYLDRQPVRARPRSIVQSILRITKRRLAGLLLTLVTTAIVLVLTIGLLTWALWTSQQLRIERDRFQLANATFALDRAIGHLEKGEGDLGRLWLGRSHDLTPVEAHELQKTIRNNVTTWMPLFPKLVDRVQLPTNLSALASTPNGDKVITAQIDGTIDVWNVGEVFSKQRSISIVGAVRALCAVDQQLCLVVTEDYAGKMRDKFQGFNLPAYREAAGGPVLLLDIASGTPHALPDSIAVRKDCLCAHYNARTQLMLFGFNTGEVWGWNGDIHVEPKRLLGIDSPVGDLTTDSSGRRLATCDWTNSTRIWNLETGEELIPPIRQASIGWSSLFDQEDMRLLVAGWDNCLHCFDPLTGERLGEPFQLTGLPLSLKTNGDRAITTTFDGKVFSLDMAKPKLLYAPLQFASPVQDSTYLGERHDFVVGCWDGMISYYRESLTSKLTSVRNLPSQLIQVSTDSDGSVFAVNSDGQVHLLNLPDGTDTHFSLPHSVSVAAFSKRHQLIVTADAMQARCYQFSDGKPTLLGSLNATDNIRALAISADGTQVAVGLHDGTVSLHPCRTPSRALSSAQLTRNPTRFLSFNPTTTRLLVGSEFGEGRQLEISNMTQSGVTIALPNVVSSAAWDNATSLRLTCIGGGSFEWSDSHLPIKAINSAFNGTGTSLILSSTDRIVIAISGNGSAQLWDLATDRSIGPRFEHFGPPECIDVDASLRYLTGIDSSQNLYLRKLQCDTPGTSASEWSESAAERETGMSMRASRQPQIMTEQQWRATR